MNTNGLRLAIQVAINKGDLDETIELIERHPDALQMMTVFGTWLHVAASFGNLEIVKRLVEMGADVNVRGGILEGNALQEAVSDGHIEIVKYLYSQGANLDTQEPEWNPLFSAIYNDHREIAQLLVDYGIDTKVKYNRKTHEKYGRTGVCPRTGEAGNC